MGMGTAGAVFDAISRQKEIYRRMLSKEMMQMRRSYRMEAGEEGLGWFGEERESFDCFYLCNVCGYLDEEGDVLCPACGNNLWIDLANPSFAHLLQVFEEEERMTPPTWVHFLTALSGIVLAAAILLGLYFVQPQWFFPVQSQWSPYVRGSSSGYVVLWVMGALVFVLLFFVAMRRRFSVWLLRFQSCHPARWKAPVPVPERKSKVIRTSRGQAPQGKELLQAPLTGRPCAAYRIALLFDTPHDARPPAWVLDESEASDLQIGNKTFPGKTITISIPLEAVSVENAALSQEEFSIFLRKRGLFSADGEFELYEAILAPGESFTLKQYAAPEGCGPVLRARGATRLTRLSRPRRP